MAAMEKPMSLNPNDGFIAPFGLTSPVSWVAMFATRYMHEYGATSEDFGRVSVADRKHAAAGEPLTPDRNLRTSSLADAPARVAK